MYTTSTAMNKYVKDMICHMWQIISDITEEKHIHLSTIAEKCELNASALYHSIRAAKRGDIVDNPLSTIVALADALDVPIDRLLWKGPSEPEKSTSLEEEDLLSDYLDRMSTHSKNQLRLELIAQILNR